MTDDPDPATLASPDIAVAVRIADPRWRARVPEAPALLERATRAALACQPGGGGPLEVSFLLAGDAELRRLNRDHRGQDKATNVLSFPVEDDEPEPGAPADRAHAGPRLLGDVALALETLEREAAAQAKTLPDHVCHLAVHGVLHLLGYDHVADAEAARMERLEVRILTAMGVADPYAEPQGVVTTGAIAEANPGRAT